MNENHDRIEGLEHLRRERVPQRDLWPGIETRLRPRRRRGAAWLALVASLLAGLTVVLSLAVRRDVPHPGQPEMQAGGTAAQTGDPGSAGRALPLDDDSRAIVKANLALVRQAERQLRQALRNDPDSPALRSLLASTEQHQNHLSKLL
jgi:hypothetical protein